jgi:hypothetical protein
MLMYFLVNNAKFLKPSTIIMGTIRLANTHVLYGYIF